MKKKILPLLLASCLCLLAAPVHADTEAVNVFVPVTCIAKNCEENFFYSMYPVDGDNPYRATPDILELQDGDESGFNLEIDYPGTYEYTISQEKGSDKDTVYDNTVYEAKVFVTEDEEGELSAETVLFAEHSSSKSAHCKFENINKKPDTPETPTGKPDENPDKNPDKTPDKQQPDNATSVIGPKTGLENNAAAFAAGGLLLLAITALFILKRRDDR